MTYGRLFIRAWLAGMLLVHSTPAWSQVAGGAITGVLKDQDGAALPGATVTVTAASTNSQRVVISTEDGIYTASGLAPNEYAILVELAGFRTIRREGVHLATGDKIRLDFELAVGDLAEEITVTANAPILRAETA